MDEKKAPNGGTAMPRMRTSSRAEAITVERLMELASAGRVRSRQKQVVHGDRDG